MRIHATLEQNEYGFLRKHANGWMLHTKTAATPVVEPQEAFQDLGREEYRVIGLGNGEARIIRFTDLHRHSDYSLQDSILHIQDMVQGTEYAGALTDHGNMYGFLEYYKAMQAAGKKPIIGMEAYMENMEGKLERNHVILLAKNNIGYRNLLKLTSESFEHMRYAPHVTWDMLEKYHTGIICLTACLAGILPKAILADTTNQKADEIIQRFHSIFEEDFYIEIQNHGIADEDIVRPQLVALAQKHKVKIVATTDTHYLAPADKEAHLAMLCLRTESTLDAPKLTYDGEGYYLHNSEDMEARFADYPEALDNTLEIADRCNVELKLGDVNLPNYKIPAPFASPDEYMCHIIDQGFQDRFAGTPMLQNPEYLKRLQYEKDMIQQMGFASYFIIVWDFINWAREHDIAVGPGRGSAAGSIAAYCMGITDVDPIKYNLLFERFLNPERVSWPDIDTDIEDSGRGAVIDYMRQKYGENNVCRIITFGTMKAKQALRDMSKVLGLPAADGANLASMVPPKLGTTLTQALEPGLPLAQEVEQNPQAKRVVELALKVENCKRHSSIHACGVCVAPSIVSDYIPTAIITDKKDGKQYICTQVTKEEVEELSIIKMDLLGLKNLGVMQKCLNREQELKGEETILREIQSQRSKVRYQDIPFNDRATYNLLRSGKAIGAFQLESDGMISLLKDLLWDLDSIPEDKLEEVAFERLVAAIALYRPGPMDYIPEYVAGIKDPAAVHYDCPQEASILAATYGVMVYQEQLMQIAQKLAGYTLGQADILRKACGKKKKNLLAGEHSRFVNGCMNHSHIARHIAEEIWAKIEKFGAYAFNRSHSVCYAYLAYLTAYMSCHWPGPFYAALLTNYNEDSDKIKEYLKQASQRNITLCLPDIQRSAPHFLGFDDRILWGLRGIAGVNKTADDIIEERNANGEYLDAQDLFERLAKNNRRLNKKGQEGLVYSGALNSFSSNKAALLKQFELIADNYDATYDKIAMGQMCLLGLENERVPLPDVIPLSDIFCQEKEVEVLGVYVSNHPTDPYTEKVAQHPCYVSLEQVSQMTKSAMQIKSMGMIQGLKEFPTKKGTMMAVFQLATRYAEMPCLMFPKQYEVYRPLLKNNSVICVDAKLQEDTRNQGKYQMIIQTVMMPEEALNVAGGSLVVSVHNREEQEKILAFVQKNPGEVSITLEAYGRYFPLSIKVKDGSETRQFFSRFSATLNV